MRAEPLERRQLLTAAPITLAASPLVASYDQLVTLTTTLPPDAAGGSVAFYSGSTSLGTESVDARPGSALNFEGGSGYATLPSSVKFTSADFTISLWFDPASTSGSQSLLTRGSADGSQQGDIALKIDPSSGVVDLQAGAADGPSLLTWDAPTTGPRHTFNVGAWNHVVVVHSGDSYTMWMNGVNEGSDSSDGSSQDISDAGNTNPLIIGGFASGTGVVNNSRGKIDELEIFDRGLSSTEIGELYNGGSGFYGSPSSGPTSNGLVAGYHFDEGSGTSIADFSGNGNDGTLSPSGVNWTHGVVNDATAVLTTELPAASDQLVAVYGGNSNYAPTTSATIDETVQTPFSWNPQGGDSDSTTTATSTVAGTGASTDGAPALHAQIVPAGCGVINYNIDVPAGSRWIIDAPTVDYGTVTIESGGTLVVAEGCNFFYNENALIDFGEIDGSFENDGSLTVSGQSARIINSDIVNNGTFTVCGQSPQIIGGSLSGSGSLVVTTGSTLNIAGDIDLVNLTITGGGNVQISNADFTGSLTNDSTIDVLDGSLLVNEATIANNGAFTVDTDNGLGGGELDNTSGTLTNSANGILTVGQLGLIIVGSDASLVNFGSFTLVAGYWDSWAGGVGGVVDNFGTVTNTETGSLTVGDSTSIIVENGATLDNEGALIDADSTTYFAIAGDMTNNGVLTIEDQADACLGGGVAGTGTLVVTGASSLEADGPNVNFGTVIVNEESSLLILGEGVTVTTFILNDATIDADLFDVEADLCNGSVNVSGNVTLNGNDGGCSLNYITVNPARSLTLAAPCFSPAP